MTAQPMTSRITVLGLGRMGTAIAAALVAAGHRTTVWNRTAERADDLVQRGSVRAGTAVEAISASPMVIISLSDYDTARRVLELDPSSLRGRALVNLVTGAPDEARSMADWAAAQGAEYLDGAMMAVPQSVATPDAFFLYSGSEVAFDTHREALDTLAASHFLGTDPAVAELWDLALLGTGYAALTGFIRSLAVLETVDVSPSEAVPLVARWLHGMVAFMSELAKEIESGDYGAGASPVSMNRIAVAKLIRTSVRHGVNADVHTPLRALLDRRVADGHGDDSFASLFELMRAG